MSTGSEPTPRLAQKIGCALRRKREQRRLTLDGIATALGVGKGTVSRWEVGSSPIPLNDMEAYCAVLEVHPADLFDDVDASAQRVVVNFLGRLIRDVEKNGL